MLVLTSSQMNEIDKKATTQIGIPEVVLMENAGFCVFEEIKKDFKSLKDKKIALFCGKGNNGGDGFVAARYLLDLAKRAEVFIFGEDVTPSSKVFLDILKRLEAKITIIDEKLLESIKSMEFDIIVDGIFGTGLKRDVDGIYKKVIEYINSSAAFVYSIDIPSGICADTGKVKGAAIKACKTITFFYPKIGNILYPGAYFCGQLVVKDIGIPERIADGINTRILDKSELKVEKLLRYPDTHKGSYGKVGVIAGSRYYSGAAVLCSSAAVMSGCGLCYLISPKEALSFQNGRLPEVITIAIDSRNGVMDYKSFLENQELLKRLDVIAFGCGLTTSEEIEKILIHILKEFQIPMIIDADGLNVLSKSTEAKKMLRDYKYAKILTPHFGEASRLLGKDIESISSEPILSALEISKNFNAICILKGSRTIITDGEMVYINVLGNAGMAKGGSGDVLTGIIASLIAQGFDPFEAAKLAVYLHSLSADILVENNPMQTITPTDIIENLKNALLRVI